MLLSQSQFLYALQRWNRGHKARGQDQGHKKISRPRTDPLEAKAKAKDTDASVLQNLLLSPKFFQAKKVFKNFFSDDLYLRKKKRSLQIFRKVSGAFQRNFNRSKIVLSSSRKQGNFRRLEASRPRPRTSKFILEDSTSDTLVAPKSLWWHCEKEMHIFSVTVYDFRD